jgi:hypothetical protein
MGRSVGLKRRTMTAAGALAGLLAGANAWAGSCDVEDSIGKAIGIEEPWLENAGYVFTQVTDNGTPQAVTLAPEVEARFNDHLGMELDLPAYTAQEPLGRAPSAFGPLAAGLKGVVLHDCDAAEGHAMLLTAEVEGQYWTARRPSVLPDEGNSVSGQLMWAALWNHWFEQGEAGYTRRVGSGITDGWFLNTSFGRPLSRRWTAQLELGIDDQLVLPARGRRGIEGSLMPQVSFRSSSGWLVALGEQASLQQGSSQTGWSSWLMLEHDFSDSDDPG